MIRHILLLTNIRHRGLYTEKKIRKLLGDVNFVEDHNRRNTNVKKRLVKVQQLYRILVETLRDDYVKYNIDFTNPEHMATLSKKQVMY